MTRSAFGLRGQCHVLRLHVRGKAGILFGGHIGGNEFVAIVNANGGRIKNFDRHARSLQLGDDGAEMGRGTVGYADVAVGDRRGYQEGTRLNAIGNDGVRGAAKFFDAANLAVCWCRRLRFARPFCEEDEPGR